MSTETIETTEEKSVMWEQILWLRAKSPIVKMAFDLLEEGMLEDKENLLMIIVLRQQQQIKALELTNQNLIADKYSRKQSMGDVK